MSAGGFSPSSPKMTRRAYFMVWLLFIKKVLWLLFVERFVTVLQGNQMVATTVESDGKEGWLQNVGGVKCGGWFGCLR